MTETREEPVRLPSRAECIAAASVTWAAARRERDELFAREGGGWKGAMAVAEAAGHQGERAEEVARMYLGWVQEEIAKRDAAKETSAA